MSDVTVSSGDIRIREDGLDDSFYALSFAGQGATGVNNIAIGPSAYRNENGTTGTNNIALGSEALNSSASASTASHNVGMGYATGINLSTGGYNFLSGYLTGSDLTSGSSNVSIGQRTLYSATTGSYNVVLGFRALYAATTASYNIAIGYFAVANNDSGENLIGIGYGALRSATAAGNVGIGYRAGRAITSGQNNTVIGNAAAYTGLNNLTTGSNNTIVGYNAAASSATVSDEITLGDSSITRFRVPGAGIDNTSDALSGTTPSVDVGARDTYTLSTSGNTTFTFTGAPSSGQVGTFSLIITAGGTHTLTWPASVDWAGGTAPDAPASGEKDIYTFMTVDGGTTWYGFLSGDAMA